MIREDRELLAELAHLNTDMAALGLHVVEGSASAAEQRHYAKLDDVEVAILAWAGDGARCMQLTVYATLDYAMAEPRCGVVESLWGAGGGR